MTEDRKQAAHAKEAKLRADREARFREKPAELRDAIRAAEQKDWAARANPRPEATLSAVRVGEVRRVLADRYGGVGFKLPDDDAGLDDAELLANCLALLPKIQLGTIVGELESHASWLTSGSALKIAERAMLSPMKYRADTIAERLGVTNATRARLKLRTIGAIDVSSEERKARRRAKKAAKAIDRRRANGAKPRADYEAESLSNSRPWESESIHRRTWERRQKKLLANAPQVRTQYIHEVDTEHGTDLRHEVESEEPQKASATEEAGRGLGAAPPAIRLMLRHEERAHFGSLILADVMALAALLAASDGSIFAAPSKIDDEGLF